MFLKILLLIIAVIILIFIFFSYTEILLSPSSQRNSLSSVCIRENCFSVEIAKTEAQRQKGLMNRKELDRNKGMLFVFEKEEVHSFWMKNTLIPLDIIWIDSNGKIVFISQNAQPCHSFICPSVVPPNKAKYVLEINAGICQETGIKVGDEIKLNHDLRS